MKIVHCLGVAVQVVMVAPLFPVVGLMWLCFWLDSSGARDTKVMPAKPIDSSHAADHSIAV